MSKAKEKKALVIEDLQKDFAKSTIGILTDYRGLTGPEMTGLRRRLRDTGIKYRVVKNTLARFAAERAGIAELARLLEGPVAIALGYGNITEPAKVLTEYIRTTRSTLAIKGGFTSSKLLTATEITILCELPPREVLLGRVLGGMQAPISTLVSVLAAPLRGVMGVLQARINQLEGEAK